MKRRSTVRTAARLIGLVPLAAVAFSARPVPAVVPGTYAVTDLGSLRAAGDGTSSALGLSNQGVVVGVADTDQGTRHAFRWDPQQGIQDLKNSGVTLGGPNSAAFGINDAGQIVGEVDTTPNPFAFSHAFHFGPALSDLNGQGPFLGGQNSRTTALNASGTACGWAQVNGGAIFPFRWSQANGIVQLTTPTASGGKAYAINTSGTCAGSMDVPNVTLATVWSPNGGLTMISFRNAAAQEAYGLDDSNIVVGARKDRKGRWRAWFANLAAQQVLLLRQPAGAQQSWAYDVNNSGQIVGSAGGASPVSLRAFIWDGGRPVDLNTRLARNSGWRLRKAFAINEAGQICGEGVFQGRTRAFLLTPQ